MRRLCYAAAALGALAVLAAGCSSSSDDSSSDKGTAASPTAGESSAPATAGDAVPSPSGRYATPTPATSPGDDAAAQDKVIYELESKVLAEAGTPGKTSGTCDTPIKGDSDQKVTCTIRYESVSVPFTVSVSGGSMVFSFRATQEKAPITKKGVQAAWADYAYDASGGNKAPKSGSVKCDATIPEIGLVAYDEDTDYACSYEIPGGVRPIKDVVTIDDDGPQF